MLTNEELEKLTDLQLFGLLFDVQEAIVTFWRKLPPNIYPDEQQALELAQKEVYAMRIAEVLIKRGKLPANWGRQ